MIVAGTASRSSRLPATVLAIKKEKDPTINAINCLSFWLDFIMFIERVASRTAASVYKRLTLATFGRDGGGVFYPEVINVVIGIIGLVLTAIAVGITIGKKNRH